MKRSRKREENEKKKWEKEGKKWEKEELKGEELPQCGRYCDSRESTFQLSEVSLPGLFTILDFLGQVRDQKIQRKNHGFLFSFLWWCSRTGNRQEGLTKVGYWTDMKVKVFKNLVIFWIPDGTVVEICQSFFK